MYSVIGCMLLAQDESVKLQAAQTGINSCRVCDASCLHGGLGGGRAGRGGGGKRVIISGLLAVEMVSVRCSM